MRSEPAPNAPNAPETVTVHEHRIWCDGAGGPLGHPRVYLEMGGAHFVECPYCDRRFVLAGQAHDEDEHTAPAAYEGSAGR
jgi:uncharacterized Zn-finger protein